MLGWQVIPRVAISFLWLQNFASGRNHTAKKVIKPATRDHVAGSSALSPEVHGTPGIVVLYSKHSTKAEFVTDKHDFPDSSSRIVNKVPSVQGLDSGHGHHKHGGVKPDCAQDLPFCLYDNDYPIDTVHDIINNYHDDVHHMYYRLNHYSQQDYLAHDNYTHGYRHKGNFVCESDVSYVRPGWAKNWKNEWVTVVNTEKYPQSVRVEICKYGGKKCEYLPPCYKSFCVQRFAYVKLLCVDPFNQHQRPIVDVFEIPTACSCFVENFVYY
ncbi:neurotrophin 1-like isoform X2 [Zootermopsis nevadensis]|nr:neurotrophin 1-like isoform X2 [Zootermopsis nevadensis]XP_021931868.1 neurotrophin 1-like isoform X2 [Zootermopsis nevadensis]